MGKKIRDEDSPETAQAMKTVRILGNVPKDEWYEEGADHWWLNSFHSRVEDETMIAAWFQMHAEKQWRGGRNGKQNVAWLKKPHLFPIYMQEHYEDVPASKEYPLEEARKLWPGADLLLADTFCYEIALAMILGYKKIKLVGVHLLTDIEAWTETAGVCFWLGLAAGRGLEVTCDGRLLEPFLYGYEERVPSTWLPDAVAMQVIVDETLPARKKRENWALYRYLRLNKSG